MPLRRRRRAEKPSAEAEPKVLVAELGEPPPSSLVDAVRDVCGRDDAVRAAYLFLAALPGRESDPQTVLGVELSSGAPGDELEPAVRQAGVEAIGAEIRVRVLEDDLLPLVRALGLLVYQRSA